MPNERHIEEIGMKREHERIFQLGKMKSLKSLKCCKLSILHMRQSDPLCAASYSAFRDPHRAITAHKLTFYNFLLCSV